MRLTKYPTALGAVLACLCLFGFLNRASAQTKVVMDDQERIASGDFTILNDKAGDPSAVQILWQRPGAGEGEWRSWANKTNVGPVNSLSCVLGWPFSAPESRTHLPAIIWNNAEVRSKAMWRTVGTGYRNLNVSYNMLFHDRSQQSDGLDASDKPTDNIGVWLKCEGDMDPVGVWETDVVIAGRQWELWRGTEDGVNKYTYRIKTGEVNNTELRLRDFIHDVVYFQLWMTNDKLLTAVEFGTEVNFAEKGRFYVDKFELDIDPDAGSAPEPEPEVEPAPAPQPEVVDGGRETMYVSGRHLYSAAGEKVVLRGVNEMFTWMAKANRGPTMAEIAKSGANCVRIVWLTTDSAADLDLIITQCLDNNMIPMVELHGATGNLDLVDEMVDYWVRSDVVDVMNKHKKWVILNIANEAGAYIETDEKFNSVYRSAITRIRDQGVTVPLVIDASRWAKDYEQLFRLWEGLRDHDPEKSTMFSLHAYWLGTRDEKIALYNEIIDKAVTDNIPLHFGEGPQAVDFPSGEANPYQHLLQKCQEAEIGWLTWSWGELDNQDGGQDSPFDITSDGVNGNWATEFARNLMVDDPNSMKNTSIRPEGLK